MWTKAYSRSRNLLALIGLLLLAASSANAQDNTVDKKNGLALYLWPATIDGPITLLGDEYPVDVGFSDIFNNLDLGAQLHYERGSRPWGFFLDTTYLNLSADFTTTLLNRPGRESLQFVLGEAAAFRRWGAAGKRTSVDLILGFRYWAYEVGIGIEGSDPLQGSSNWVDAMVGGRVRTGIGRNWVFSGRADVGAGGSDLTWNIQAAVKWQVSETVSLILGYRYMSTEYSDGSGQDLLTIDLNLHGPLLAVGFRW